MKEKPKASCRKRRSRIFYLPVALLLAPLFSCAQHASKSDTSKVDELFLEFSKTDSPGAAVCIVKDGRIVIERQYGSANLEYNIPITPSTVFHIGSVSKQFTGFALLLLEEEGRISLDDDIRKYLPEVPVFGDTIRIRHLLRHMSGLREQENLLDLCGISNADVITTDHLLKLIRRQKELNFRPGDEIEYCNTGYFLLAQIIERVTGESLRDWTAKRIFTPLGMTHTQFYDDNGRIVKGRAYPYYVPEGTKESMKGILSYSYVGPTSVFTTSHDMGKWLINLGDPKVGGTGVMKRMLFETDTLNNGQPVDYSYGIGVTTYKELPVNFHSGSDAGYRAFDAYFPEQRFGVAVLSNFYSIDPQTLGFKIADIFLQESFSGEQAQKDKSDVPGSHKPHRTEQRSLTKRELFEYAGNYFSDELETHYAMSLDSNGLVAKHWRNDDVVLRSIDRDTFSGAYPMSSLHFSRDRKGQIEGFRVTAGRARNVLFRKN